LTREDVTNIKPYTEVYLKALNHFAINSAECLIVKDSLFDVEVVNIAGIDVVAIQDEYSMHEATQIKNVLITLSLVLKICCSYWM
jgi:beta-phosphoglucomutase